MGSIRPVGGKSMRKNILLSTFLLFYLGGTISPSQRSDDWWLNPRVEVATEFHPYFIPKGLVVTDECSKRDYYVAPWVTEVAAEISAYNSKEEQTDSDPFIAANNRHVFPGGIATNILPCGTKVMIPDLFGDTVFTVNDRMNPRYHPLHPERVDELVLNFDVWLLEEQEAKIIGRKPDKRVVIVSYAGV